MIRRLFLFLMIGVLMSSNSFAHDCPCTKNGGQCHCDPCNCNKNLSYEESLNLAKKTDKKVFVFFTGDHCSWCKKQKLVLSNKDVSKKLEDYIVCYVDVSKNRELSRKYKVSSVPNYFLIDKDENVLKEANGYKKDKEFLSWLE